MGIQIVNWLYQNAMAIFISAIASLLISKDIMTMQIAKVY